MRTGKCKLVGNRAYKHSIQIDIDVGTAGNRISRLHDIVSETIVMITTV
jgi:hypothetical protein